MGGHNSVFHFFLFLGICAPVSLAIMSGREEMHFRGSQNEQFEHLKRVMDAKLRGHPTLGKAPVLAKFLRFHNFDLRRTIQALEESHQWDLERQRMGDEEYRRLKTRMDGNVDAEDKEGRPILYLKVNKWNWGLAIQNGEMELWKNTFYRMMEEASDKALAKFERGGPESTFFVIADYEGWSRERDGSCQPCLTTLGEIASRFESRWPNMNTVVIINTPNGWEILLNILKGVFSMEMNDRLRVFNEDKGRWWNELAKVVDEAELRKLFGGFVSTHHVGNHVEKAITY